MEACQVLTEATVVVFVQYELLLDAFCKSVGARPPLRTFLNLSQYLHPAICNVESRRSKYPPACRPSTGRRSHVCASFEVAGPIT
jgi:hypothetical protein